MPAPSVQLSESFNTSVDCPTAPLQLTAADRINAGLQHGSALWPGECELRPKQVTAVKDGARSLLASNYDHGTRPPGTGKSIVMAATAIYMNTPVGQTEQNWDVPVLFVTEYTGNCDQLAQTFTDPELFGLPDRLVSVWKSGKTSKPNFNAPILITTYDRFRKEFGQGELALERRPFLFLDEVDNSSGDGSMKHVNSAFSGGGLLHGWTASDKFAGGKTVADVVFRERQPFHAMNFPQAVDDRECCGVINIPVIDSSPGAPTLGFNPLKDYGVDDCIKLSEFAGRAEAAMYMHMLYECPTTGLRFRDMNAFYFVYRVGQAEAIAARLNQLFGDDNFAVALTASVTGKKRDTVLEKVRAGEYRAVVGSQMISRGLDSQPAQIAFVLAERRRPALSLQQGGRIARMDKHNPGKVSFVVNFISASLQGSNLFGEQAGGRVVLPTGMAEFTAGRPYSGREPDRPPDITLGPNMRIIDNDLEYEQLVGDRTEAAQAWEVQHERELLEKATYKDFAHPGRSALVSAVKAAGSERVTPSILSKVFFALTVAYDRTDSDIVSVPALSLEIAREDLVRDVLDVHLWVRKSPKINTKIYEAAQAWIQGGAGVDQLESQWCQGTGLLIDGLAKTRAAA